MSANEFIEVVELKNSSDQEVESGIVESSWDELVDEFSEHKITKIKDGPCFIPVEFKSVDDWVLTRSLKAKKPGYRNDKNIKAITMAVIDLDEPGAIEEAERKFADFERIVYSTYSYSKEKPYKFRMALRLAEPVPAEEWSEAFYRLAEGINVDSKCRNLSRIFFKPSHSPDAGVNPVFKHHKGIKVMSKEDIYGFKVSEEVKRRAEISYSTARMTHVNKNHKHHLPGVMGKGFIRRYQYGGEVDYTYKGMLARHQRSIEALKEGSGNHDFAMSTVFREVSFYGGKTRIDLLCKFIAIASEEFSSRGILRSGDTLEELPELIVSSMDKNVSGIYFPVLEQRVHAAIDELAVSEAKHAKLPVRDQVKMMIKDFPSSAWTIQPSASEVLISRIASRCKKAKSVLLDKEGDFDRFCNAVFRLENHYQSGSVNLPVVMDYIYQSGHNKFCKEGGISLAGFTKSYWPKIRSAITRNIENNAMNMDCAGVMVAAVGHKNEMRIKNELSNDYKHKGSELQI